MKTSVGIEALAVALPRRTLHLEDLARARGVDPAKYIAGLGVREMAVTDPGRTPSPSPPPPVARLIESSEVDPASIGMLAVGTETGVDHSKPVASYVQGAVGLPRHNAGLRRAARLLRRNRRADGSHRVDRLRRRRWEVSGHRLLGHRPLLGEDCGRAHPGRRGGGAAGLVRPELFAIDLGLNGTSSAHVFDFWRPLGSPGGGGGRALLHRLLPGGALRLVPGLAGQGEAKEIVRRGASALPGEQLAAIGYTRAVLQDGRKAHARLRRCDLDDVLGAFDEAREERESASSFERQVAGSLTLLLRVGNIYTGSLYLGFAGMLNAGAPTLAGKRIGLFSYGSGCASEFFSGIVGKNAAEQIQRARLDEVIGSRERVTVEEYERLMALPPRRRLTFLRPRWVPLHRRQPPPSRLRRG
jgi:hydroxymethylglutaryl-CoA synthase